MQSLTPKTLAELAQALSTATEKAKIIAGGTDFIIKERAGKFAPDLLIYPGFIPELNTVTKENGVLRIGAAVPMNGITAALKDDKAFCAIADAASDVGSPQIRAKVLGRNALRVYRVNDDVVRKHLARDRITRERANYCERPDPTFATRGPKTRREFLNLQAWTERA